MTTVIDEEGRLFGRVNVIDALFVLLIVAVVAAGVSFVTQAPPAPPEPTTQQFAFTAEVSPPVATAMQDRDPTGDDVLAIDEVFMTARETVYRDGRTHTVVTMEFVATLPVVPGDGTWEYRGERLLIGQGYDLDLGYTIVRATLVGWEASA